MRRGLTDEERKEEVHCTRTLPCTYCENLILRFGKEKVQTAFMVLGAGASAADVENWLTVARPNPENS